MWLAPTQPPLPRLQVRPPPRHRAQYPALSTTSFSRLRCLRLSVRTRKFAAATLRADWCKCSIAVGLSTFLPIRHLSPINTFYGLYFHNSTCFASVIVRPPSAIFFAASFERKNVGHRHTASSTPKPTHIFSRYCPVAYRIHLSSSEAWLRFKYSFHALHQAARYSSPQDRQTRV